MFPKPDEINLLVRFPVPARKKGRTEQALFRRYLALEEQANQAALSRSAQSDSADQNQASDKLTPTDGAPVQG